ncbi:MAG: glycosyltransferase family 39 protein [Deltaproteobacteria bacterium]|nr:glycosyltransferase family 39 protein [Deltaproteobacteria bacterium]
MKLSVYPVLLAFIIRFAYLFFFKNFKPELWELNTMAHNILSGKGMIYQLWHIDYYAYYPPVLPYLHAFIYWISAGSMAMLGLSILFLSAVSAYLVYNIAQALFSSNKIAFIAGLLYAVHPGLIVYSSKASGDNFFIFCFLLLACLLIRLDLNKKKHVLLYGLTLAIAFLSRSVFIIFVPLFILYHVLKYSNVKKTMSSFSMLFVFFMIFILPWGVRNQIILKKPVFTVTTSAQNLWLGNNPNSTGTLFDHHGIAIIDKIPQELKNKLKNNNEIDHWRAFQESSKAYIMKYPLRFVGRTLKKFIYFWSKTPTAGLLYPKTWLHLYLIFYGIILIFAFFQVVKMCLGYRSCDRNILIMIGCIFLLHSGIHSIYYVETRHRFAIEAFILILAAPGIQSIISKIKITWLQPVNGLRMIKNIFTGF